VKIDPSAFHAFTVKYNGLVNRIVTDVHLSVPNSPDQFAAPLLPQVRTTALWDTGATSSVLTATVAKQLALTSVGLLQVKHAGGSDHRNAYVVNFFLPNMVVVSNVMVSECADTGQFGAIIGMDIIARGDFSLTNVNGETWASFRIPSVSPIDYVAEADRLKFAGVNRNAPCPCGKQINGKPVKFKHCHGDLSLS